MGINVVLQCLPSAAPNWRQMVSKPGRGGPSGRHRKGFEEWTGSAQCPQESLMPNMCKGHTHPLACREGETEGRGWEGQGGQDLTCPLSGPQCPWASTTCTPAVRMWASGAAAWCSSRASPRGCWRCSGPRPTTHTAPRMTSPPRQSTSRMPIWTVGSPSPNGKSFPQGTCPGGHLPQLH